MAKVRVSVLLCRSTVTHTTTLEDSIMRTRLRYLLALLAFALVITATAWTMARAQEPTTKAGYQPGRWEIVSTPHDTFLLDSTTGKVWKLTNEKVWHGMAYNNVKKLTPGELSLMPEY